MEIFNDLRTKIIEKGESELQIFIITRKLKDGLFPREKKLNKYNFDVFKLDIDLKLKKEFFNSSIDNINDILEKKKAIEEYDVTEDNKEKIYQYKSNKVNSFNKVIEKLNKPSEIINISNIKDKYNELWAYCIFFEIDNNVYILFKKLFKTKIAIDRKDVNPFKKIIASFDINKNLFEYFDKVTITFDINTDCIYMNDFFYTINKNSSENLLNVEDDFKKVASDCIDELRSNNYIEGIEFLEMESEINPTMNKRLTKIFENKYHENVNEKRIKAMKVIAKKFNLKITFDDTKVIIKKNSDINDFIKLLDDYYLESLQKLGYYGSYNKKKVNPQN